MAAGRSKTQDSARLKTHCAIYEGNLSLAKNLSSLRKNIPLSPKISCAPVQFMGFLPRCILICKGGGGGLRVFET